MRAEDIVGDKVLGLLGPNELSASDPRVAPPWLERALESSAAAAKARLRASGRDWRPLEPVVDAMFRQSVWSGPLLSARTASAMWGKSTLVRALPDYRLRDLVIMRDKAPLDLTPLGKPSSRLGKRVGIILRELQKPNTGLRLQSVQDYHPRVKIVADRLAKVFATKVNVNGYASLSPGTIFQEHWDAHDVLLVQTHGSKTWTVRPNSLQMPVACHRQVLRPDANAKRTTIRLQRGLSLYLPRGHWHVGEGDESIHVTFGVPEDTVALRIADVALRTIGRHIQELAYRAPMFMFDPDSREAHKAIETCFESYIASLRSALLNSRQISERPAFFGRRFI